MAPDGSGEIPANFIICTGGNDVLTTKRQLHIQIMRLQCFRQLEVKYCLTVIKQIHVKLFTMDNTAIPKKNKPFK